MKKIGNILTTTKINTVGIVNIINSIQDINDNTIPTLIVGYHKAKAIYPNISILNKKINDNIFWTFGKREKRDDYEKDINLFYKYIVNKLVSTIPYYYVNICTLKYGKVKKILNILYNNDNKYIYIKNNIIYIYYNKYILGVSLEMLECIKIPRKKIFKKIFQNIHNIVRFSDSFLETPIKNILYNNKKYAIPYFMYIYDLTNEK